MITSKKLSLSSLVNIVLTCLIVLGHYLNNHYGLILETLSLYGLSGSITNSLAIIMIFHRIPGLIGSGIIEKNFDSFKKKLKETLMIHLFNTGLQIENWNIEGLSTQLYEGLKKSNMAILTQFISRDHLASLLKDIDLSKLLNQALPEDQLDLFLENQINKLTPDQIKNLITHILEEHLQWLVLWGAVFGIFFGIVSFFVVV